jgi:lipopolysaccharide export system protein LptA
MHAIRDGNMIEALELHLFGPDKNGKGQRTFAKGPGKIDLLARSVNTSLGVEMPKNDDAKAGKAEAANADAANADGAKAAGKPRHTLHALWKDNLIATKERDGDRVFDLLTFTGDAVFLDDDHKQSLSGQRLQVWLEQTSGPAGNQRQAGGGARQKPTKVEAFERVTVQSPEMQIERCHHLIVVFKEVTAKDDQLPNPNVLPAPPVPGGKEVKDPQTPPMPPVVELRTPLPEVKLPPDPRLPAEPTPKAGDSPGGLIPVPGKNDKEKPRKPIRLKAQEVVAYVSTQGTKKQLQELVTEGDVHVQQDGDTPKDKGLDITGDMLNLIYHPLGNRLLVYGDTRHPARLQIGELTLIGPKVDIDQKDNTAAVDGVGAMRMPSNTTFDGGKPAREGAYVDIHWKKDMLFNGKFAQFNGGVEAYQEAAHLRCKGLQVTLDRYVSFKEGQKENQNAKVDKLVCDQKVWIEDKAVSPEGKTTMLKRVVGSYLDLDNPEGRVYVPGPGTVRQLSYGVAANLKAEAAPKEKAPAAKQELRLILTRVDFEGSMSGKNKPGLPQLATFYDNVEVFHQPADNLDVKVNPNDPPKDGFYLRCNVLKVAKQERDGRFYQTMVAENNAFFRTPEFYGNAKTIKYDESREIIIFEGEPTILYKLGPKGAKPQRIEGKKILYNRKTGNFDLTGGSNISSWLWPEKSDRTPILSGYEQNRSSIPRSFVAGLNLNGEDEAFLGLGLIAGHDRQKLAADRAVDDLALIRRGDREADAVVLVGAVLDDDLRRLLIDERERALLVRRQ